MHAIMDIALITVVLVLVCYHWEVVLEFGLSVGIVLWCAAQYGNEAVQSWLK